jgi:hypothetical protein
MDVIILYEHVRALENSYAQHQEGCAIAGACFVVVYRGLYAVNVTAPQCQNAGVTERLLTALADGADAADQGCGGCCWVVPETCHDLFLERAFGW